MLENKSINDQNKAINTQNDKISAIVDDVNKDPNFTNLLRKDPQAAAAALSNALKDGGIDEEIANELGTTLTSSNVTISSGQNLAKALTDTGLTPEKAAQIQKDLDSSNLVRNNALENLDSDDSKRVIKGVLANAGITDQAEVEKLTNAILEKPEINFSKEKLAVNLLEDIKANFNEGNGVQDNVKLQFGRLLGAQNRGLDAIRDNNGNIATGNVPGVGNAQNLRTQYNNTVVAERSLTSQLQKSGLNNAKVLTIGTQALIGDQEAQPLVGTDEKKAALVKNTRADIDAQLKLGTAEGNEKCSDNTGRVFTR